MTGASKEIGAAIAKRLSAAGAAVVVNYFLQQGGRSPRCRGHQIARREGYRHQSRRHQGGDDAARPSTQAGRRRGVKPQRD